ncbi:MAG: hypothetical protein IKP58_00065 [Victivallales bacterium]|nr:hypothetical protein [Victivallales bacterium]
MLPDAYSKEEKDAMKLIFMAVRVHFAFDMNGTTETTTQSAKYEKDNCFSNCLLHRRFIIDGGGAVI